MKYFFFTSVIAITLLACNDKNKEENTTSDNQSLVLPHQILNIYPHDTASFTQGLFYHDGILFESTGQEGTSRVQKIDTKGSKTILPTTVLNNRYFGEGACIFHNKLYQLTWQSGKVFVYDATTFAKITELRWDKEGWGITTDGTHLIISTGTSMIYYVEPESFTIVKSIQVLHNNQPLNYLNELEYVDGYIYANVFMTPNIVKIDAQTGNVVGILDFSALYMDNTLNAANGIPSFNDNVLNGIAYNPSSKTFLITGKKWSKMFEVKW